MNPDSLLSQTITHFVSQFYVVPLENEVALNTLKDSLSPGQLNSKLKILELCQKHKIHAQFALFLGHWHGFLPLLLKNFGIVEVACGLEQDQTWVDFSNRMNIQWAWRSMQGDATTYAPISAHDLIVNTSCEHMTDEWLNKVPSNTVVIAQSTDYLHPDHINRCENLIEFQNKFQNFEIVETHEMIGNVYKRFTVIARRK